MYVQIAEARRKPALLLRTQGLLVKEQNLVFDQQFTQAIDGRLRQLLGQGNAVNDGP
jgi:hypothetical protein